MLYNPPTGGAANDPFVGANIAAGIQGSKVPPGAVEFPQRELISLITAAGLAPTNTDLQQALRAVRSGILEYSVDGGTVNAPAITPSPAHTQLVDGLHVRVRMKFAPTGPSNLSVSSLVAPIEYLGGFPLIGGDWAVNDDVDLVYNAPREAFQILGLTLPQVLSGIVSSNTFQQIVASLVIYVGASGSDSNSGRSAASPKLTIAGALAAAANFSFATTSLTIQIVGGGTFALPATLYPLNGSVIIDGGGSATITASGTTCFGNYTIQNCASLNNTSNNNSTIVAIGGGTLTVQGLTIAMINNGVSYLQTGPGGSVTIAGGVTLTGSGSYALYANGGSIFLANATINVSGTPTFTEFANAQSLGLIFRNGAAAFSGAANGSRYIATANGTIVTAGAGPYFFPGSSAGTVSGGQYV